MPRTELVPVPLRELIQIAGLHPTRARPLSEAIVLTPGCLVTGLLRRALDLGLAAVYQQVRLGPLFAADGTGRFSYAIRLRASRGAVLPASLLAALREDPFALVCRAVEQTLLVQHGTAAPLSDGALAALVTASGDQAWLLASPPYGSARVSWLGEPLDAVNLIQVGPEHALTDLDDAQPWAESEGQVRHPQPPVLSMIRVPGHRAPVDAVLLDRDELDCLAPLLAGETLADTAFLVPGRDRHLLSAPGGILAELPVGEALTCVGPGSLYVPIGYRFDPPVPPSARATLFPTDSVTAMVVLPQSVLRYDLGARLPVWRLWAGAVPDIDLQLPRSALADLRQVEQEVGQSLATSVKSHPAWPGATDPRPPAAPPVAWQEQAYRAEREGDYAAAAQLYARHNEPLRAARLYERLAQESS